MGVAVLDMPMDYDSEFNIHNVELAEEGSSTVSPVLRPYDYEDGGNLRFDSLVENEVFLGITGQEDNQWIEEYSRGTNSSVIESRHDNAWSEATSPEFVEMLLKSVGQGALVTELSDEPGELTTNMDPKLKQDNESNLSQEAMITNKEEEGALAIEQLDVGDEPGSLSIHMDPNLMQDNENDLAQETMVTNKVEEGALATEELNVSDEPGSLSINMDPNLKRDDENNHAQEAMITNKEKEGVFATEEMDANDEPNSSSINMDPILNQDDENNHAQVAMVSNKEEEGALEIEDLYASDEPGRLSTNMDSNMKEDEENNHAQEAMVTKKEEDGALTLEELDVSDEPGSLTINMDPNLKQNEGNNHAQEAMVTNKEEEVAFTLEELDVSDEPSSLTINMDPNLKQNDGSNHAQEAMVTNKQAGALVIEELSASDDPGKFTTNMDPNLKQDDGNNHAHEAMNINKTEDHFSGCNASLDCQKVIVTITKGSQEMAKVSGIELDSDVLPNKCDFYEEREEEAFATEELDVSDKSGSLAIIMDPNLKQYDENSLADEEVIINKHQDHFTGSNTSLDFQQDNATINKDSQEEDKDLYSDFLADKCDLFKEKVDGICDDVNHVAKNIAVELIENKMQEDLSTSKIECVNLDASKECNMKKCPSSNEAEFSTKNSDNPIGSDTGVETCTNSVENPLNVVSLDNLPFEVDIPVDEESMPAGSCNLLMTVACAEVSHDRKCAIKAFPEVLEHTNDIMDEDLCPVSVEDDEKTKSENIASLESNVCSPSKVSDVHSNFVEGSVKPDCVLDTSELGEGSIIIDVGTNMTKMCSSAELLVENTDLLATPKAHSVNLNDNNQSPASRLSGSVQHQVNDEIQSSEQDGGTCIDNVVTFHEEGNTRLPVDMDIAALDSQKNVESISSPEGCKAQGSEADMTILVEPGYIDAESSPVIGGMGSVPHDNEKKEEGYVSDGGTCENESMKVVSSMLDRASFSVVETGASPHSVGEVVYGTSVENRNEIMTELAHEANPVGLGGCTTPLTMDPIPCDLSAMVGDNVDAGGNIQESISVHHVNMSSKQHASTDVVLASECDDNHMHEEDSSVSVDKVHIVSPLLNTNNTELSQSTRVIHGEGAIDENVSLPKATEDEVLPLECNDSHMRHEEDSSVSMDKLQSFSPLLNTNNSELSQSTEVKPSERAINENTSLSQAAEDMQAKKQCISSNSDIKIDKSFTFEVSATAELEEKGKGLELFPASQACNLSTNMEVPCIKSSSSTLDPRKPNEATVDTSETPGSGTILAGAKERKTRRKSVGKESVKKGKETTTIQSGRVKKSSPLLVSPPLPTAEAAADHAIQFQESRPKEKVECSVTKPTAIPNLPDLNNATCIFYQPFTNNQQVQLRAQILVYGSLISGMPPEEAHMIAAFGQSDAGRKTWESALHACVVRVHGQKSKANTPATPQPRSDVSHRSPDLVIKHSSTLSGSNKVTPPALSPLIPVSSPLWNMSTPSYVGFQSRNVTFQQSFTPTHPSTYQTPPNPLWLSQNPFLGQWGVASSPALATHRFSALPITEAVKLTPVKVSGGGPHTYSMPVVDSTVFSSLSADGKLASGDSKSRKRKKVAAAVTFCTSFLTSIAMPTPVTSTSDSSPTGRFLETILPTASNHVYPRTGYQNMENAIAVEETLSKVKEAKLQAENAALLAAAEVSSCQDVWTGLDCQKYSGVVSDAEAKLMSSVAAAASVAKMASAAAKIASNVAEQAKLMADEVFLSSKTENFNHILHPYAVNKSTPTSILKSVDKTANNLPNSIISAAREAARRRIEAASAASKHAENLDAIVKAAELAAEAVSQVGKIVAMRDSLDLRKLAEAGPEGFWKMSQLAYGQHQGGEVSGLHLNSNSGKKDVPDVFIEGIQTLKHGLAPPVHLAHNQMMVIDDSSVTCNENDTRTSRVPNLSKVVGVSTETCTGSPHTYVVGHNIPQNRPAIWEEHNIKEGCLVEVYKEDGKYKGAWLTANVLSLKDDKALVCYIGIQSSDEGSEKAKEWVAIEVDSSEVVPRIRIAHPMTTMQFEGTRKRRRTVITNYAWSKGDRVDVWMQDCWREGVVTEPNKIDATSLTVQFSALGETSVVRSWHVRPTLMWKDRKWIEWNGYHTSQGDSPKEKRMKLGSPDAVNDKRKDKVPIIVEQGRHEEQGTLLPLLSAQESCFNVGKSTNKHGSNLGTIQKNRARVVFGVPKPGKKQKFMAVSTQYVDDRTNKINTMNGSFKFSKPPGARVSKNDVTENQATETKSRLKSRKPPVPLFRTLTSRDSERTDVDSVENTSIRQNQTQVGSSSNKSRDPAKGPASKKAFTFTSKPKSEPSNRGKSQLAPKIEAKDKSNSQVNEPRRSNRRIQPTSRLLEGIQSSLTISKLPSVSHATQRKVTPKGGRPCIQFGFTELSPEETGGCGCYATV
ncbi:hypothetical protein E3N88_30398 [Mikania micrantha]|uniref:Agenet domain-containing protein n=1 Tax=Mikania micrantha TaxID=192012 RepID=A0A5N6MPH4_9ASTR|nr:hypothetical protein E3N88_30398 [Mikania micrantha]